MPKEVSVAIIPAAPYAKIRNQEAKAQNHDILDVYKRQGS